MPGGLALSVSGPSYKPTVTASWNAVSGASTYELQETDATFGTRTMYSGPNTTASGAFAVTGEVQMRVRACNGAGCSGWSSYRSVYLNAGSGGFE